MKTKRRGQISIEYLIVLGFATFAITAIVAIVFFYSNSVTDQIRLNHARNFGTNVIDNAESVYFSGEPSKATINPYLPKGIRNISINLDGTDYRMFIEVQTNDGKNTLSFTSKVPLVTKDSSQFSMSEGIKNVVIEFAGDQIDISF